MLFAQRVYVYTAGMPEFELQQLRQRTKAERKRVCVMQCLQDVGDAVHRARKRGCHWAVLRNPHVASGDVLPMGEYFRLDATVVEQLRAVLWSADYSVLELLFFRAFRSVQRAICWPAAFELLVGFVESRDGCYPTYDEAI